MVNRVRFPGLGIEVTVSRLVFPSLPVYWYGLLIAVAFLIGFFIAQRRARLFALDPDKQSDCIFLGLIFGIIGARLYYVIFNWDYYSKDLIKIITGFRDGGLAIYGGIILGFSVAAVTAAVQKVKIPALLDNIVPSVILGQAIGRWGNFFNQEAFGCNTSLPWGMTSEAVVSYLSQHQAELASIGVNVDPSLPVHPTFLYESLWCIIGFLILLACTKYRRFDGELLLVYAGWYGLGRAFIEGLRIDSLMLGSIRISQLVALVAFAASVIIIPVLRKKYRGSPHVFAFTDEGKAITDKILQKNKHSEKN